MFDLCRDPHAILGFVCVEILRPSQPNGVMSSAVSLPSHTFNGQAVAVSLPSHTFYGQAVLCTVFCQKLIAALLESAKRRE